MRGGEHRGLDRRLGEAEVAEHLGNAGSRHDHGEETDVVGRQQAGHDDHRRQLDEEAEALPRTGDGRPANRAPAERLRFRRTAGSSPRKRCAATTIGCRTVVVRACLLRPGWNMRAAPVYCGTTRAEGSPAPPETGTLPPPAGVPRMKGGHQPPWRASESGGRPADPEVVCVTSERERQDLDAAIRRVVQRNACIGCGLCTRLDTSLELGLDADGFLRPHRTGAGGEVVAGAARSFEQSCPGCRVAAVRPTGEPPAPNDGFLLRRVGGVGER